MSETRTHRSPYRIVAYTAATCVAVLGAVWLGMAAANAPATPSSNLNSELRPSSQTRDRFQELYDLGWRGDGSAGNTAVEAVWFFPGLVQRLGEYAERSAMQAEILQLIQSESDASLIPISVFLQRNAPLERNFDWENVARLRGDVTDYRFERFDVSAFPSGRDDVLSGIIWFRKVGPGEPDRLTLTFSEVPGNIKPTVFTWAVKALELYDATPAEQGS